MFANASPPIHTAHSPSSTPEPLPGRAAACQRRGSSDGYVRQVTIVWVVVGAIGCSSRRASPLILEEHAPTVECGSLPTQTALLTALDDAPTPTKGEQPRVVGGQLDTGCAEAVLVVRVAGDTFSEHPYLAEGDGATDHVWAFRWIGTGWAPIGHATFNASLDRGTTDYRPGVTAVRIEPLGPARGVLIITEERANGSVDPRWHRIREHYYVTAGRRLVPAFACSVAETRVSGQCRSGSRVARELELTAGHAPNIRVTSRPPPNLFATAIERRNRINAATTSSSETGSSRAALISASGPGAARDFYNP